MTRSTLMLIGAVAAALACGTGPKVEPKSPAPAGVSSSDESDERAQSFLQSDEVTRYSTEATAHPGLPLSKMPGEFVAGLDGRLASAALLLARAYAQGAARSSTSVYEALWRAGAPEARVMSCSSEGETREAALNSAGECLVEAGSRDCNRFGLASYEGVNQVVAVGVCVQALATLTERVPVSLQKKAQIALRGVLDPPFTEATVVLTSPSGRSLEPFVRNRDRTFESSVSLNEKGLWQVELIGLGPHGPESLLNFPVRVGVEAEPFEVRPPPALESTEPEVLEAAVVVLLNKARRDAGLSELESSRALTDVARRYSEEMAQTGLVVHVSPNSGSVVDRVERAGLRLSGVAENLAMASSATEAHDGLMRSPGHRANILSSRARRVGVGVAVKAGEPAAVYVTQVFELAADESRLAVSVDDLRARVQSLRKERGLPPLGQDGKLDRVAQKAARSCPSLAPMSASQLGGRYAQVSSLALVSNAPLSTLASVEALLQPGTPVLGLATRRIDQDGVAAVCVVVLLGTPASR